MRFGTFPRIFTSFLNQMSEDFLPQSRLCSTAKKAVHRLIRRKVMRKLTPLTAGLYNVQHGVCQFALAPLPIPHSRIQWLYFFPLAVCQVRRVRLAPCSYFFHAAIIPCFTYDDKLLQVQNTFARLPLNCGISNTYGTFISFVSTRINWFCFTYALPYTLEEVFASLKSTR